MGTVNIQLCEPMSKSIWNCGIVMQNFFRMWHPAGMEINSLLLLSQRIHDLFCGWRREWKGGWGNLGSINCSWVDGIGWNHPLSHGQEDENTSVMFSGGAAWDVGSDSALGALTWFAWIVAPKWWQEVFYVHIWQQWHLTKVSNGTNWGFHCAL